MVNSISKSTSLLGWDITSRLCAQDTTLKCAAISPLSVSFALGMLAGGASLSVKQELCLKLGIKRPDELNTLFSSLIETFSSGANSKTLSIANAVFADRTFAISPSFAKHVESFRAYCKADFPSLPEGTAEINGWISQNTNDMIKNMLTPQNLQDAHVALVNALAFKGTWQNKFDPADTKKNYPFRVTETATRPTDMMFLNSPKILLHNGSGYKAIRLPYASSTSPQMSFIAYLPNENKLLKEVLLEIRNQDIPQFRSTKLTQLGFPKLNVKTAVEIFGMLKDLGYPLSKGFPEMGSGPNEVGQILHNAVIKLDEHGTEVAAATVVMMTRGMPMNLPPTVIFDRPFAYSIVVDATSLVVFSGVFTVEE